MPTGRGRFAPHCLSWNSLTLGVCVVFRLDPQSVLWVRHFSVTSTRPALCLLPNVVARLARTKGDVDRTQVSRAVWCLDLRIPHVGVLLETSPVRCLQE